MDENVAKLVTTEPDEAAAKRLKDKLKAQLIVVCAILDEINAAGFDGSFNLGRSYNGNVISSMKVTKEF